MDNAWPVWLSAQAATTNAVAATSVARAAWRTQFLRVSFGYLRTRTVACSFSRYAFLASFKASRVMFQNLLKLVHDRVRRLR